MIGTLLPLPRFTGWSDVGDPIPGGFLDTFASGTTNPLATYTDAALAVPNANPIVLDAAGRAVVFLAPGLSYTIRLRTAAGVTVWSQDEVGVGVTGADVLGTAGATLAAHRVVYLADLTDTSGSTVGRWYLGDSAQRWSSTTPILGITPLGIAIGAAGAITTQGIVTGLAALVPGTLYYVGAAGALTAVPPLAAGVGRQPRPVGIAVTTTTLFLTANPADPRQVNPAPGVQYISGAGAQNNIVLRPDTEILFVDSTVPLASPLQLTGFTGGREGRRLLVLPFDGTVFYLVNTTGSSVGNQLQLMCTSASTPVNYMGYGVFVYDTLTGTPVWRLFQHDSGLWLDTTPVIVAGDFTAGGTMAWGVTIVGDVTLCEYRIANGICHFRLNITTSSITAPVNPAIKVGKAAYGGFLPAQNAIIPNACAINDNAGGVQVAGYAQVTAGAVALVLSKLAGGNFTASVNLTDVYVDVAFYVS